LPTDRYCFEGFLPAKQKARRDKLAELRSETRSIVLYESVHRIRDCLADLVAEFGEQRNAFIGRELTKMHEQCVQATLGDLLRQLDAGDIPSKGEFVVVITGSKEESTLSFEVDQLLVDLAEHLPPKTAAKIAAKASGESRNDLYERLLTLNNRK
jgi:16S rRNA (cytidine1402-2'-O)-methyltransferase